MFAPPVTDHGVLDHDKKSAVSMSDLSLMVHRFQVVV